MEALEYLSKIGYIMKSFTLVSLLFYFHVGHRRRAQFLELTNSSLSGTREMKSASSLFAIAFGLMSFLKNLFVPQAMIRYLQKYFAYPTSNLLRYEIICFLNLRDIFYQTYVV